ncbi:MAG TPA: hypothetical protein VIO15_11215, partial [Bacteroidales bacterium]
EVYMHLKTVAIHSRNTFWSSRDQLDELGVDAEDLAREIETKCNELEKDGYKVIKIVPINSGNQVAGSGAHYTESVLVVAQK